MNLSTITTEHLENPPEWLVHTVEYLKHHATEKRISPKALAQLWESKLGRRRSRRIYIICGLIQRKIASFKELTQGEINALSEIGRWVDEASSENESLAP
jgi:hypothetical protein